MAETLLAKGLSSFVVKFKPQMRGVSQINTPVAALLPYLQLNVRITFVVE